MIVSNDPGPGFQLDTLPIMILAFVFMIAMGIRDLIKIIKDKKKRKEEAAK